MAKPPQKPPVPAKPQPTVFILYVPGGAMLGIIPAIMLSRLESLTETPTQQLFQVLEGVSTGAILAGGLNMPGMTARKGAEMFVQIGPQFFPDMPGRWTKMNARNGINLAKFFYNLDPRRTDYLAIANIRELCQIMKTKAPTELADKINALEKEATERWLTKRQHRKILRLCQEIGATDAEMDKYADAIAELLDTRSLSSSLGMVFKSAVVGVMDYLKDTKFRREECLYDPKVPEATYKKIFGERMISGGVCSTYISAYDIVNNRIVTFSSLKKDLFSKDPAAPATIKNDIKVWDAVMASTANPLAFPPHITETNLLCSDKAPIHKPRSVKEVLAAVPAGTRVVLVIAGTGKYLSKELVDFLEKGPDHIIGTENAHQHYRNKLEKLRDYYAEFGVLGNLAMGREIAELEGYTSSDALEEFTEKLGAENIFHFSPRLAPHTPREQEDFPTRNILDASRENILRIIRRGRKMVEEEDVQIKNLAQMLADNLHLLGQMDDVKYARVCKKIGLKTFNTAAEIVSETAAIEQKIVSNDNSTGLRRLWRGLGRIVVNGKWDDDRPPPPPSIPPSPGGP